MGRGNGNEGGKKGERAEKRKQGRRNISEKKSFYCFESKIHSFKRNSIGHQQNQSL